MDHILPNTNLGNLTTFYSMIFLCGNYSNIIILYENSTVPILEPLVLSSSDYSSTIINIDLEQRHINATIHSDEHSLIILLFDNDVVTKSNQSIQHNDFKYYCHYLFVSKDIINDSSLIDKLITLAEQYKIYYFGLITSNENFKISRIIYNQHSAVTIPISPNNGCSIYDELFYAYTKALKGEEKYVYVLFDAPRGINLTSRNKDGKQIISMGGRDAYFSTLIPSRINITLKLYSIIFSADYNESDYEYAYLKQYFEKTYEEDNYTPKQLEYETVLLSQSPQ